MQGPAASQLCMVPVKDSWCLGLVTFCASCRAMVILGQSFIMPCRGA